MSSEQATEAATRAADPTPDPRAVRKRRLTFALLLLAGAGGATVLYLFDPTPHPGRPHYYPPCLFHQCTGLYCPGCGTTRALHALLHGRLGTALRYNPLVVLIGVPAAAWSFFRYGVRAILPHVRLAEWRSVRLSRALGVAVLLFSMLRNVPYAPFTFLAPPEGTSARLVRSQGASSASLDHEGARIAPTILTAP